MNKELRIKILIGSMIAVLAFAAVIGNSVFNNEPSPAENISEKQTEAGPPDSDSGSWFSVAPTAEAKEIIEMRTSNSKTWFLGNNPDGTAKYIWRGAVGDIHYKNNFDDPDEPWKDINNNIVASDRDGYDYQMTEAGYKIYLKEKFNEGKIVRYEKQGEWLEMEPGALSWGDGRNKQSISGPRNVLGSPTEDAPNQIYWPNAYGGKVDFKLIAKPFKLMKVLGIENFNHLPAIDPKIFLNTDNVYLELNLSFEYSGSVIMEQKKDFINFKNSKGEILWQFMKPNFWDSSEPSKEGVSDFIIKEVRLSKEVGSQRVLSIRAPYAWLKQATFPVYIDPTFNVGASADDVQFAAGVLQAINTTSFDAGNIAGPGLHHAEARFTSVNITQGSTINSAKLTVVARAAGAGTAFNSKVYAENVDDSDTIDTTAEFNGASLTTGTEWDSASTWTAGDSMDSPDISAEIQTVVNRALWVSGNAIGIFWKDDSSVAGNYRLAASWDNTTYAEPTLTITWTEPSTYQPRPPAISPSGGGFLIF